MNNAFVQDQLLTRYACSDKTRQIVLWRFQRKFIKTEPTEDGLAAVLIGKP